MRYGGRCSASSEVQTARCGGSGSTSSEVQTTNFGGSGSTSCDVHSTTCGGRCGTGSGVQTTGFAGSGTTSGDVQTSRSGGPCSAGSEVQTARSGGSGSTNSEVHTTKSGGSGSLSSDVQTTATSEPGTAGFPAFPPPSGAVRMPRGRPGAVLPPHPEAVYTAIAQVGAVGGHNVPVQTGGFSLSVTDTQRAVGDTFPRAQSAVPASGADDGAPRAIWATGDASPRDQSAVRAPRAARGLALLIHDLVPEEHSTRNRIVGHNAAYIELLLVELRKRALGLCIAT